MNKTLIRSYTVAKEGDLVVQTWSKDGKKSDLSKAYEDVPRDRRRLVEDAFLDVFRYEDGEIIWSGSSNGHGPSSAMTYKFLFDAFVQDLGFEEGNARAF